MDYKDIVFTKSDGVATITLNRPDVLNAYGVRMGEELAAAVADVKRDDEVRVLILTGTGRGFSSGHNLTEVAASQAKQSAHKPAVPTLADHPVMLLKNLDLPTIAAVNGIATGGGFALALMCDIRIAGESARFSEIHVMRGMLPGAETWLLPRAVGASKAAELIFTSDIIDAREAERIGLVSKVVSDAELMAEAMALARKIAQRPPAALKLAKRALYHALDSTLEASLEHVAYARAVARQSGERAEGVKAFVEKRKPAY